MRAVIALRVRLATASPTATVALRRLSARRANSILCTGSLDSMPIETIKCQECGSADVTEFKPGTYVCGHCEAVFKHVTASGGGGGCQIDDCGVPAVGRCGRCRRRFCKSHQAVERDYAAGPVRTRYTDFCEECRLAGLAADARARAEKERTERVALENIDDPFERLCVALQRLAGVEMIGSEVYLRSSLSGADFAGICPELWENPPESFDLQSDPPWNGSDVAAWFARRAQAANIPPDTTTSVVKRRTLFGTPKSVDVPKASWHFPGGSTRRGGMLDERWDAFISADGRLSEGIVNLTGPTLVRMAERLERARLQGH